MTMIESNRQAGLNAINPAADSSGDKPAAHASELLPEGSFVGDPLFDLQALMAELQLKDKSQARERRQVEEQAAVAAVERSVHAMEEQADQQMWSGVFSGLGKVACGVGGGLGGGDRGGGLINNRTTAAYVRIGGTLVDGAMQMMSAKDGADATRAETEVKRADADYDAATRAIKDAQTAAGDAEDAMRTTLQRLEQILKAEEQAKQAAIGGNLRG